MTKFSPERCQKIIESISNRVPYEIAAKANGIHEDTLYAWLNDGYDDMAAEKDTEKSRFSEAIKKIEEQKIVGHLNQINESPERWQAQAWILERRWWKYFSPNAALIEFNKRLEKCENEERKKKLKDEANNLNAG